MEGMAYIYELFETLPRCGPGDNKSTRRAFNTIPNPPEQPIILAVSEIVYRVDNPPAPLISPYRNRHGLIVFICRWKMPYPV